jgi:hypothetical protein
MDKIRASNPTCEVSAIEVNGEQSLLDAVHAGIARVAGSANRRRGLVVVYDDDSTPFWSENEIHELVRDAGTPVYTIGVVNPIPRKPPAPAGALLGLVAIATRGGHYPGTAYDDAPGLVERIETEILNQYVIEYTSSGPINNGQYRKLDLQVTKPPAMPPLTARFAAGLY